MSGAIKRVSGSLLRVAKNGVIEFFSIQTGPLNGSLAGDCSQFLGGKVAQLSAVVAHRGTRPAHDCNITWFQHWVPVQNSPDCLAKPVSLSVGKESSKKRNTIYEGRFTEYGQGHQRLTTDNRKGRA